MVSADAALGKYLYHPTACLFNKCSKRQFTVSLHNLLWPKKFRYEDFYSVAIILHVSDKNPSN